MTRKSETAWPDLAGKLLADGSHVLPVRVYYEDTDTSGRVYHGAYIRFFERGRSDWLRCRGMNHAELAAAENPAHFAVRHMTIDFLKPAQIDDVLEVHTRIKQQGGASLVLDQRITRGTEALVSAQVQVVLVSAKGKPMRVRSLFRQ